MKPTLIALLIGSLVGCAQSATPTGVDRLRPCTSAEGPTDAFCGTYQVFENRDTRQGRTIDLRLIVLPALGREPKPDPLFFLAGGPGQGAAVMASGLRQMFQRIQSDRDIVLVDQRGTGKSGPLECEIETDSLAAMSEPMATTLARFRRCLDSYDADVRLYTTEIAMDDLNEVREHLGYSQINVYGGSYGTRAALTYLRRHGSTVRAMVIDGVAPPDMRLPLFMSRDGQRALDRLLADCDADAACRAQHPNLGGRLRALVAQLDNAPERVRLVHPRTGIAEEVTINSQFVATAIFGALYSPLVSSLLPELIARAERRDYQGLLALATINDAGEQNMSVGMQMSVLCAEDHPRIQPEQVSAARTATVFGAHLIETRLALCDMWPKGQVSPAFYEPVKSDVPTLILSGDLDPVTPPEWGESVLPHLSRARHVVVPGTGHGVLGTGCGMRLLRAFLDTASPDGLDTTCVGVVKRPSFFLAPSGPDPGTTTATPPARP